MREPSGRNPCGPRCGSPVGSGQTPAFLRRFVKTPNVEAIDELVPTAQQLDAIIARQHVIDIQTEVTKAIQTAAREAVQKLANMVATEAVTDLAVAGKVIEPPTAKPAKANGEETD